MTVHEEAKRDETDRSGAEVYREEFTVSAEAIDGNGHVNNVTYVQWMQDLAVRHFEELGGMKAMDASGGTWVVRCHRIQYLSPAHAGERVLGETWVEDRGRVRSHRRYRFTRLPDETVLARGETEWVFVDAQTGRPRSIPETVRRVFKPQSGRDEDTPGTGEAIG
jgi:acyl-CoA thioester hydrolase